MDRLYKEYQRALADPELCKELKPGSFADEIGLLMLRYTNGATKSTCGRVKMKNHWAVPTSVMTTVVSAYDLTQERFASPLDCCLELSQYWSAHKRDRLFGAHFDAFSSRPSGSCYMNPEYDGEEDLYHALLCAIAATTAPDAPPVCTLAVYGS
jgi:hypothetical protein